MTDADYSTSGGPGPRNDTPYGSADQTDRRSSFPWERVIFTGVFAVAAWFAFWIALFLGLAAAVVRIGGFKLEVDIAHYAMTCARFLSDALAYVAGRREEKPFPFSPLSL